MIMNVNYLVTLRSNDIITETWSVFVLHFCRSFTALWKISINSFGENKSLFTFSVVLTFVMSILGDWTERVAFIWLRFLVLSPTTGAGTYCFFGFDDAAFAFAIRLTNSARAMMNVALDGQALSLALWLLTRFLPAQLKHLNTGDALGTIFVLWKGQSRVLWSTPEQRRQTIFL